MATTSWASLMTTLGRDFSTRSAQHDQDDSFVAENYRALRERGAFAAGVPAELGGGVRSSAAATCRASDIIHSRKKGRRT